MTKQARLDQGELNILLIDEDTVRAAGISSALDKSRYKIQHLTSPGASLLKDVDRLKPDIIVIDVESPNRDILESLHTISSHNPRPIVMFSGQEDTEMINLSVESGVSAYVVGDTDPARVKPILDAAVARFKQYQELKSELVSTKSQLASREIIDQAKRLLMKSKSMNEQDAFHSMRKLAMNNGQKIEDVARTVVSLFSSTDSKSQI